MDTCHTQSYGYGKLCAQFGSHTDTAEIIIQAQDKYGRRTK